MSQICNNKRALNLLASEFNKSICKLNSKAEVKEELERSKVPMPRVIANPPAVAFPSSNVFLPYANNTLQHFCIPQYAILKEPVSFSTNNEQVGISFIIIDKSNSNIMNVVAQLRFVFV